MLAAVDGLSIRAITRSKFIRESISREGMILPKAEADVQELIIMKFMEVKQITIQNIKAILDEQARFSMTMDEWTSIKNRKYLNICLFGNENIFFNLGMVRIPSKSGADEIRNLLENRLNEYNINFQKHIVATITDGPNVMKKLVKDSEVDGIFCLNHAIHLAVIDIFYKSKATSYDCTSECSEDDDNFDDSIENNLCNKTVMNSDYKDILNDTRKIIKIFKKSPAKNAVLQKYVMAAHNKEIALYLDVITRWNSMVPMLEKFLLLKNSIKKALIDLEMGIMWNEENLTPLTNILQILKPIQIAVEAMSRRDTNLLAAEAIVITLCTKIKSIPCSLRQKTFDALHQRIEERREKKLYSLLHFLKDPDFFNKNNNNNLFQYCSKYLVIAYAENLFQRIFENRNNVDNVNHYDDNFDVLEESFEQTLNAAIKKANVVSNSNATCSSIKKELKLFEACGKKTQNIENLYKALLTIRPTSVESERVFSTAGVLVNKIRNRLSDESINALIVLKTYFQQNIKMSSI